MSETILISINSWQEKDLLQTMTSALLSADAPENVRFSVFNEGFKFKDIDFSSLNSKVFYINAESSELFGMGLSRLIASTINDRDYDFHLQIDAHMFFEKSWDTYLKDQYNQLSKKYENPIITAYTPWWEEQDGRPHLFGTSLIDPKNYSVPDDLYGNSLDINQKDIRVSPALIGTTIDWSKEEFEYKEHYMISAHFMFSSPKLHRDIIADPFITWGGDEPVYALRASTRGWQMFTVKRPLLCHKNKWKSVEGKNVLYQPDDWRSGTSGTYNKNNLHSDKFMLDLFLGRYFGYWGAPDMDSLKEYESKIKITFKDYYDGDGYRSFSYWDALDV
jgi:hypothetical protein